MKRSVGRFGVVLSSVQQTSCVLVGCIFNGMVQVYMVWYKYKVSALISK